MHGSQEVHWDQALILQSIDAGALASRVFREDPCLGETNNDQLLVKDFELTHITNAYVHHSISLIKNAYQYTQSSYSPHGEVLEIECLVCANEYFFVLID